MLRLRRPAALAKWSWADLASPLALLWLAWLYLGRLGASRMLSDDEGSYFYAIWRMGLGERPYCDFLTPQLPGLLLPGGWLFRLTGPDFVAARLLAVVATLGAVVALWWTSRRLFGPAIALAAGLLLALHPDVFLAGRVFRADPFMLLWAFLGLALFTRAAFPRPEAVDPPDRRWLLAAGLAFGLATVTKLFGPFLLAGCLLWLGWDAWRRGRPWRAVALDIAALVLPCLAVVTLVFGAFLAQGCDVYGSVLGHHLRQGAGLGPAAVLGKGLDFFVTFLRYNENALLVFVALVAAVAAWRRQDRPALVFALVLPTLLAFLVLSRELFSRHLNYVIGAFGLLFALAAAGAGEALGRAGAFGRRSLPVALIGALLFVWYLTDRDMAWQAEDGTERLADFIQLTTEPGDWILADNSEFAFWGQRVTSFSAASLSAGAAQSGQITWERVQGELDAAGQQPAQVWVDRTEVAGFEYGQLRFLRDLARFEDWLDQRYDFAGPFRRAVQQLQVFVPQDRPLPLTARFDGGPTLLAGDALEAEVPAGASLEVRSAWQLTEPLPAELVATARLVDEAGVEWAQSDDSLMASPYRTTDEWLAGELSSHRFPLEVPAGTPPGRYTLRLGLYRRADGRPLPASGADGAALGSTVPLGTVLIRPGTEVPASRLPEATPIAAEAVAGLRLLARGPLPEDPFTAGTVLPLDLWWRAEGVQRDLAARVTLGDPAVGTVVADLELPLGLPGSPSSEWPAGPFTVRQQLRLPVRADAGDGMNQVQVQLVDAADGSAMGPAVSLGAVQVAARDLTGILTERPQTAIDLEATLGEAAVLVGADLPARANPGSTVPVRLVWQARAGTLSPLNVTVQLLDAAGRPVAQHDGAPAGGERPTTGWLPGEYVVDEHRLALPADLQPGVYSLIAALYDPSTMTRVGVTGTDSFGQVAGDAARLGMVPVEDGF